MTHLVAVFAPDLDAPSRHRVRAAYRRLRRARAAQRRVRWWAGAGPRWQPGGP